MPSGESTFGDMTRVIAGKHRSGALLPMYMITRENPDTFSGESYYTISFRPMATTEQCLLTTSAYTVTSASQGTLNMLGMDALTLSETELLLTDLIENFEGNLEGLLTSEGTDVIFLPPPSSASGGGDVSGGSGGGTMLGHSAHMADPSGGHASAAGGGSGLHSTASGLGFSAAGGAAASSTGSSSNRVAARARLQIIKNGMLDICFLTWRPLTTAQWGAKLRRSSSVRVPQQLQAGAASMSGNPTASNSFDGAGLLAAHVTGRSPVPAAHDHLALFSPGSDGSPVPGGSGMKGASSSRRGVQFADIHIETLADHGDQPHGSPYPSQDLVAATAAADVSQEEQDDRSSSGSSPSSSISSGVADGDDESLSSAGGDAQGVVQQQLAPLSSHLGHKTHSPIVPAVNHHSHGRIDLSKPLTSASLQQQQQQQDEIEVEVDGDAGASRAARRRQRRQADESGSLSAEDEEGEEEEGGQGRGAGGDRAGDRNDDASSHGSSSKFSVGRKSTEKLRRVLSEGASGIRLPGLRRLKLAMTIVAVTSVALAATTAVIVDDGFKVYSRNLSFSSLSSRASDSLLMTTRLVANHALLLQGWTTSTAADIQYNMDSILRMSTDFNDIIVQMHELVRGTSTEGIFPSPSITIYDFSAPLLIPRDHLTDAQVWEMMEKTDIPAFATSDIGGTMVAVGTQRSVTLRDFGLAFASNGRAFANSDPYTTNMANEFSRFIRFNGRHGASASFMVGALLIRAASFSKESAEQLQTTITGIVVAMIALCVCATAIIIPYLVALKRARDAPIKVFLQLPNLVARQLQILVERRIKNLKADTDEEASDDDMSDGEEDDAAGMLKSTNGQRRGSMGDDMSLPSAFQDGYADCDWDAVYARITVEETRKAKKAARKDAKGKGFRSTKAAAAAAAAAQASTSSGSNESSSLSASGKSLLSSSQAGLLLGGSTGTGVDVGADGQPVKPAMKLITTVDRKHKASRMALCKLLLFLTPIAVVIAFYLGLWLMASDVLQDITNLSLVASLAGARVAALRRVGTNSECAWATFCPRHRCLFFFMGATTPSLSSW